MWHFCNCVCMLNTILPMQRRQLMMVCLEMFKFFFIAENIHHNWRAVSYHFCTVVPLQLADFFTIVSFRNFVLSSCLRHYYIVLWYAHLHACVSKLVCFVLEIYISSQTSVTVSGWCFFIEKICLYYSVHTSAYMWKFFAFVCLILVFVCTWRNKLYDIKTFVICSFWQQVENCTNWLYKNPDRFLCVIYFLFFYI